MSEQVPPLPWCVTPNPMRADGVFITRGDTQNAVIQWQVEPDLARYIVTACNAFPELLAALSRMLTCHRAAMDAAQSGAFEIQDRECRCGACDQARAVIAKAEGR